MKTSEAINGAVGRLEEHVIPPPGEVAAVGVRRLLDSLLLGAKSLHVSRTLLLSNGPSGQGSELVAALSSSDVIFEHVAATLGIESLYRAEHGAVRAIDLATLVQPATPPDRALRFLTDAANCYLLMMDKPCIAMCRGAVEVLVEELWEGNDPQPLGRAIRRLLDKRILSQEQADSMWFINEQAKDVLHDEVASGPLDSRECLRRLARLLHDLGGWQSAE